MSLEFIDAIISEYTPTRAHWNDAGLDLFSMETKYIPPNNSALFSTGIKMAIPSGYYGQVSSRSSLAIKNIEVGAGIIDSSYRGEIKVLLRNFNVTSFPIEKGQKIAQLIIQPCWIGDLNPVTYLEDTNRGDGGFGSTGK